MVIRMKFTMDNYKLWLQEFYTEYPGRSKEDKDKGHNKATEKAKTKDIP